MAFLIGTVCQLAFGLSENIWATYWRFWLGMNLVFGVPATFVYAWGAIRDLRRMLHQLRTQVRDDRDDGRIEHHHLATEPDNGEA